MNKETEDSLANIVGFIIATAIELAICVPLLWAAWRFALIPALGVGPLPIWQALIVVASLMALVRLVPRAGA